MPMKPNLQSPRAIAAMDLTRGMKDALIAVAYGVRKYRDGFRSIETGDRVDGRSLEALYRRDLIGQKTTGGNPMFVEITLTEAGDNLFEEELRYET